jgi:hypothetical protein
MKRLRIVAIGLSVLGLLLAQMLPAAAVGGRHCSYRLVPIGKGVAPHAIATRAELIGCFDTYSEAISAATRGAIELPRNASPATVTDEQLAASTVDPASRGVVVIGTEWNSTGFAGSSVSYEATSTCTASTTWEISNLGGDSDKWESGKGFGGCDTNKKFANTSFSGSSVTCTPNCSTYGSLNNQVSSLRWRI